MCTIQFRFRVRVRVNADINNEVGSATMSQKDKTIDNVLLSEMCELMSKVRVRVNEAGTNTIDAPVLQNSFAVERNATTDDFEEMASNWIDEESDPLVIEEIATKSRPFGITTANMWPFFP